MVLLLWNVAGVNAQQANLSSAAVMMGPPQPLTWEQCIRLTVAHNPELQASREGILNSEAVRKGAYATLYPHITASLGDTRAYTGAGLSSPSSYATTYSEELSLSQTIFDGFTTRGNIDRGRAELNLAFASLNSQKADTSFALKSAFAQLLYSQSLIKIDLKIIDVLQTEYRVVKLLYEGGQEDKGAMLLSQAQYEQAVDNLEQARRGNELAGLQLAVSMGVDLPPPIQAVGDLLTQPLVSPPDYRQLALQTPAYFQKRAQVDAAAAGVTLANSGWYPTVTANASTGRSDSTFPSQTFGWIAGVSASYPLFQGGQTYFDVKAATALFRQSLANLSAGTDQAAYTLATNYVNLANSLNNVTINRELLDADELRYKIADASYRNGLDSFQDFNTITQTYIGQEQTYLSAQLAAVIAEANWEMAKGQGSIP